MQCVEVGSFEGLGSLVLARHLCSAEGSRLLCIDPLDDVYVRGSTEMAVFDDQYVGQFARFCANTAGVAAISLRRGTSTDRIPEIEDASVDFAYIDGDHSPGQVFVDASLMLPKLKSGGVMLFDDYTWRCGGIVTADGIERFLDAFGLQRRVVFRNAQLAFRKP
jgi:hypothetical protein